MADQDDVMKYNAEQRAAYENKMKYYGLAKGMAAGAALGLGVNLLAKHRFPIVFKSPTFRVAAFMIPFIGLSRVGSEQEYHHAMLRERGVYAIEQKEHGVDYSKLSGMDKVMAFGKEHKLPLIFTAWVGSLGLSGYLVWRDKLMSSSQKIVQVRMYAQFLTLLLVVATAVSSIGMHSEPEYIEDPADKHHHLIHNPLATHPNAVGDHWRVILDEESETKAEDKK
ncbi:uncharacterized protein V1518DRAFT_418704 [Limtongia smithiae]|uniref:uncharacterized protein n=1 Tax=Limtongia smithiae TaxID=1125753 RepID=UPI0034CDDADD